MLNLSERRINQICSKVLRLERMEPRIHLALKIG
jgi:hypothetical protein